MRYLSRASSSWLLFLVAVLVSCLASPVLAQVREHSGEVEGVVRDAENGAALAGATVWVEGTGKTATTHGDGSFHIIGMADGTYSIRVTRLGYRSLTVDVAVSRDAGFATIEMERSPIDLDDVIVTANLTSKRADEALRPVNVMAGDELQSRLTGTVAETLASEPGLASTSMGPATARPVIRGLSGDRVMVLEDGSRVADVSGVSGDHATAVDPASARRIEVVRGSAALLYGSNALGGVINVIRDEIPSTIPHHPTGALSLGAGTVAGSLNGSGSLTFRLADRLPLRLELGGGTTGDVQTPLGQLENTFSDRWTASAGVAYFFDDGLLGASFRSYRNNYGIPGGFVGGHEAGVRIEMERISGKVSAVVDRPVGPFERIEVDGSYGWYQHTEIEPPDILGTYFDRQTVSGELLARHGSLGPPGTGAVGARAMWEDFGFAGGLHTPASRRTSLAAYIFEEVELEPFQLEAGFRYDWVFTNPLRDDPNSDIGDIRDRTFHALSASAGLLFALRPGLSAGVSLARAFRTPDISELYSEGPHLAAYVFEVGNPSLANEIGTGVDAFIRITGDRIYADLTGFYNSISGYIYGEETGKLSRVQLPVYQFQGKDALLTGFEASLDMQVATSLAFQGVGSYVRGTLRDTEEALPLIPPLNGRVAIEYDRPQWFARAEVQMGASQERVGAFESATDGYTVFNLAAGLRLTLAGRLNVVTASLDNFGNKEYRNHLSRVKEIMPEAGRGLRIRYRMLF